MFEVISKWIDLQFIIHDEYNLNGSTTYGIYMNFGP